MTAINIVRDFVGDFDEEALRRMSEAPAYQLDELSGQLSDYYRNWSPGDVQFDGDTYYLMNTSDWLEAFRGTERRMAELDSALLYFQNLAIADPIAYAVGLNNRADTTRGWNGNSRQALQKSFCILFKYRQLLDEGSLRLLPLPFLFDKYAEDQRHKLELLLNAFETGEFDYDVQNPLSGLEIGGRVLERNPTKSRRPSNFWVYRHGLCQADIAYRSNSIPLITNKYHEDAVNKAISIEISKIPTEIETSVATAALSYSVPGIGNMETSEVLRVRNSSDTFRQFRAKYGQVVRAAVQDARGDQGRFDRLFRESADSEILPIIRSLEDSMEGRSSIADKLIPCALSVGGAVVCYNYGEGDLTSVLTGLALGPTEWLLRQLQFQCSPENRQRRDIINLYNRLIQEREP